MSNKTKTNLWLDLLILVVFLLADEPAATGIPVHEWMSLAFIVVLVTHMVLHWDWLVSVTLKFFKILFHESRLNYVIDFLLLTAFVGVMLSGILISRSIAETLGIHFTVTPAWRSIHSLSADGTLLFTGLHFALHWKWIVNTTRRYIITPARSIFQRANSGQLAVQPVKIDENN